MLYFDVLAAFAATSHAWRSGKISPGITMVGVAFSTDFCASSPARFSTCLLLFASSALSSMICPSSSSCRLSLYRHSLVTIWFVSCKLLILRFLLPKQPVPSVATTMTNINRFMSFSFESGLRNLAKLAKFVKNTGEYGIILPQNSWINFCPQLCQN